MAIKQTRIFVPPAMPFNDTLWAETLVGTVVAPLAPLTEWFWFSRYVHPKGKDPGDCDIKAIPDEFGVDQNCKSIGASGLFRSLRFRYNVSDEQVESFEVISKALIESHTCVISDFRPYPLLDDLSGDRFFVPGGSQQRRIERATLMVNYLYNVCRLFIHALEGPDANGRYRLESNNNCNNPGGSLFESGRHLFCNITGVRE